MKLAVSAAVLVVVLASVWLGSWQWDRYEAKAERKDRVEQHYSADPVPVTEVLTSEPVPLAREWTRSLAHTSLFGPWSVKVVNELDRCSKDAQDMLLTYLDRMKPGHAFLGTTNLDVASLTERFQTRFQPVRLQPPENEVLAQFLARRWGAPIAITRQIAEGARGNVRAAMADLEMWIG